MEDSDMIEQNDEVRENAREPERSSDDQYPLTSQSSTDFKLKQTENNRKRASRSRSRSQSKPPRRKQRKSANAFLNFLQDFKKDYTGLKSQDLFRLGGQMWRRMSSAEKLPYMEVANAVKQQQQNGKNERQNKPVDGDHSKKVDNQKDQKKKKQERKRSKSRTDNSDTDQDSLTSGTDATMTSEDVSDLSS